MDTRYSDRGYKAEFNEYSYGAFVSIYKDGKFIKEIAYSIGGGNDAEPQVSIYDGISRKTV